MKALYFKHIFNFKKPGGTSRGVLKNKTSWFILIISDENYGVGECSLIDGLSPDPIDTFESKLKEVCNKINLGFDKISKNIQKYPSILFGLEMAFISYRNSNPFNLFKSNFTKGNEFININGLIWMGEKSFMKSQIKDKIENGFNCLKIKIGGINFSEELNILKSIRSEYTDKDLEIRLDANGSFKPKTTLNKLNELSKYKIHSIEQPIQVKQWDEMARICEKSPVDIALDEELIGIYDIREQKKLLSEIKPHYLIIKPSLIGGLKKSEIWIELAKSYEIKWWVTSALESNVGLNCISQWVFNKRTSLRQGLGTGMLYSNNIESPLFIEEGNIKYNPDYKWETKLFDKYILNHD